MTGPALCPRTLRQCSGTRNWSMNRGEAEGEFLVSNRNPLFAKEMHPERGIMWLPSC